MKKLNPGKVLLILLALSTALFGAGVTASLDKTQIYKGDTAVLTITAEGDNVTFPAIQKIGDASVLGTSSAQNTTIINGRMSQSKSRSYTFAPLKSTKIPSFNVTVDGKVYKTNPLQIEVVKPTASKAGAPYLLQMVLDKHRVKVGESVRLDLKFKQKRGAKADKIEITPPKLENFWVKEIKGSKQSLEGDYVVQTYSYLLFPQKPGDYTIPSVVANIGTRVKRRSRLGGAFDDPFFDDPFFNSFVSTIEWKKVFSNEEKLHVDPLPDNLEVFGHFTIKADVDKHEVSANKPVNLTITIKGEGNVDDIKKFDPDIPDAVVYADEPKIETGLRNGKYTGTFTQKIAIVADHDYTIPPLSFSYFDKVANKKVTIRTNPIKIRVKGGSKAAATAPKMEASTELKHEIEEAAEAPSVQKSLQKPASSDQISPWLYLLAGFLLGGVATWGVLMFRPKSSSRKAPKPVSKLVKKAKNDKELYNLLLPYAKEGAYIEEVLHRLEENLYKGAHHKINRDEIVDFFEEVVEGA